MIFNLSNKKALKKGKQFPRVQDSLEIGICFEPLEPRLLLSGSWGGGVEAPSLDSQPNSDDGFGTDTVTISEGPEAIGLDALSQNQHVLGVGTFVDVLADAPVLNSLNADNDDNTNESTSGSDTLVDRPDVNAPHEIVFINENVDDYEQLIDGLKSDDTRAFEVVRLDADRDGITQISDILADRSDLTAVHVISHGADGQIKLGSSWLNGENIEHHKNAIAEWGNALTAGGDILFYGCNIAADTAGQRLVADIATLTGADVAASKDPTGGGLLGANWELEYAVGSIDTANTLSTDNLLNWEHLLAVISVNTVNDMSDGGDTTSIANLLVTPGSDGISLREAIIAANNTPGADEILLSAGIYNLTLGPAGDDASANGDLDITEDLTITGAGAANTIINGGGNDRVFDIRSGTVTLSALQIQNGNASLGGGIVTQSATTLTLEDVRLSGNTATDGGGAIYVRGVLNLDRVLVDNNTATNTGGGVRFINGSAGTIINSTLSGNQSGSNGGAIHIFNASVDIVNTTIAFNSAATSGGGINVGGSVSPTLLNTILSDNSGGNVSGSVASLGYNIDSDGTAGLSNTGDLSSVDPKLDALADNGGTLMTHALLVGSPAVDPVGLSGAPNTDQRGFLRGDGSLDIGAYEYGASATTTAHYLDQFNSVAFNGNDGSLPWTNEWQEIGESDGAGFGSVSVWDPLLSGDNGLYLWANNNVGAWRQADLSGATSAVLSFDWAMLKTQLGDQARLQISTDGVAWTTLDTFDGPLDHSSMQSASYDISTFIDSDTRIRFETVSGFSSNEVLFVDNVSIEMFSTPLVTSNLSQVKDTFIDSGNPTDNFGADSILRMDEAGGSLGNGHVLLQFDLSAIPAGATITGATLQLEAVGKTGAAADSSVINVYEVIEAWDEGSGGSNDATWNNRQTATPWLTAGGSVDDSSVVASITVSNLGGHTWDITYLVQEWHAGTKTNNGLMLASTDTGTVVFTYDSREGATPPQLVITYTNVGNDAPTVGTPIADQSATEDVPFSFTFAANTFNDVDAGDSLTYTASGLPGWLTFDGATRTFSGTPLNADVGMVTVTVRATDTGGAWVEDQFDITVFNVNDAGTVTIDNLAPMVGDALTASVSDPDGVPGTISYQWQHDGVDIVGATSVSYTTVLADIGAVIRVITDYTDDLGTAESLTSAGTAAVNTIITDYYFDGVGDGSDIPTAALKTAFPVDTTLDNFDPGRDAFVGLMLAGSDLGINEVDTTKYQQWLTPAGGTKLNGPASLSLWSTMKDFDLTKAGSISAYLVDADATGTDLTEIANATITRADWDVANTGSWIEDTFDFGNVNYTLAAGRYLGVKIVVNNGLAADAMWLAYDVTTSPSRLTVTTILNAAPVGVPVITGTVAEDQVLTADTAGISDADGLGAFSYQWLRNGPPIVGATGSSYTLDDADVGQQISVEVSYTDGNGTYESLTSAQVGPVTNVNDAPSATNLTITSSYTEGDASVPITDIVVSDVDTGEMITATLTLADTSTGSLSANDGATYDGGTGGWTITGTVTTVNTALGNLVFLPTVSNNVDTFITVSIDDGDEDSSGPLTGMITLDVTPADITSDLVVHLEFSEGAGTTAFDSTTYSNDANLAGSQDWTNGPVGGGFHFDYSDGADFFEINNAASVENVQEGSFTISAWFKADDVPPASDAYGIIVKEGFHTGLWYNSNKQIVFEHTLLGPSFPRVVSANTYDPGTFHHIAATLDRTSGTMTLYVDGVFENSSSFTPGASALELFGETWKVGTARDAIGFPVDFPAKGSVDDVRIYTRAITAVESAELFNLGNEAPSVSGTYTMAGTDENTTSTAVQVSSILTDVSISANDPNGDTLGMAVFAATGLGNWQYSTDGVSGWTDFGIVDSNAALLLSETTWVRYVPDGNNGESAGFNFRAWDQTTDLASINGTQRFGNTTPGGGITAYSNGSANVTLTVSSVNDAPTVANPIPDQVATEDTAFTFAFAANTFADVDVGDTLTYTSDASGWLSFDAATRTFSGTPLNSDVGTVTVTVTADDGNGGTVSDTFDIMVSNTNDAPTVANPIPVQGATEDTPFSFQFAANTFNDVDAGDSLTYTASGLPAWLIFDGATRTFSGTPLNADVGTVTITVRATDASNAWVEEQFDITVSNTNDTPTVANPIADQSATEDTLFNFTFAANTFNDVDAGDSLTYTANGLPGWLIFDGATRTFSGTPANADVGTVTITVRVTDASNAWVEEQFDVTVSNTNDTPTVANPIADQSATEDTLFNFTFAANTFNDVDAGDSLTYTASGLPGWIIFDGATRTFSGTPANADVGTVTITVRATDASNAWVEEQFDITVSNTNDTPTVANPIADQSATEDTLFNFTFAANTFNDVDAGDSLTYTANGLPGWLIFDGATRTFSGTPANADVGTVTITVRVTDASNAWVEEQFDITVSNTNDVGTIIIDNLTPTVGDTLTAIVNDPDGATGAITYQWYHDGVVISGATGNTYTTILADEGKLITVTADYTDDRSTVESLTSAGTAPVAHLNVAPTATNINTGETYTEDIPLNLTDIVVMDTDSSHVTVTLTLTDTAAGSLSTGTSGTVTATFSAGVWAASGPIADVNALLAGVVFTPSSNYDNSFAIDVSVDDGVAAPITGIKLMTATPVGDTPQANGIATPATVQSGLIVIDRNADDGVEVTHFRIANITNGTLFLADGVTPIHNGDHISVAQGQAGVRFTPTGTILSNGSFNVESSEDGVSVAQQSGAVTAVITVIPPPTASTVDTPSDSGDTAELEPDIDPETTEPDVEPEEATEEIIPETVAPPVNAGPVEERASQNRGFSNARTPFLIKVVRSFTQNRAASVDAKDNAERLSNRAGVSQKGAAADPGLYRAARQISFNNTMSARAYHNMVNSLDDVKKEMANDHQLNKVYLGSAIVSSVGLSVGYVVWLIRGGMLLSTLLSSIPAWQILDPLPILARKRDGDQSDDDESLETLLDQDPQKTEPNKKSVDKSSGAEQENDRV